MICMPRWRNGQVNQNHIYRHLHLMMIATKDRKPCLIPTQDRSAVPCEMQVERGVSLSRVHSCHACTDHARPVCSSPFAFAQKQHRVLAMLWQAHSTCTQMLCMLQQATRQEGPNNKGYNDVGGVVAVPFEAPLGSSGSRVHLGETPAKQSILSVKRDHCDVVTM